jgi:cell division protein FtsB
MSEFASVLDRVEAENKELRAEIARLRESDDYNYCGTCPTCRQPYHSDKEIKRLNAVLSNAMANGFDINPTVQELRAEIGQLQADVREIASQCHNLPRSATVDRIDQIARRALEKGK